MANIRIKDRWIGDGYPTYIIAEMSANHAGSIERAKEIIRAAKEAGADYGKAYTPWEWQAELKEEADRVGIDFFSTPFDKTSVDFLENIGVEFYKIASFEMIDLPLLEYVAKQGKPIIMSTGMASVVFNPSV